MIDILSADKRPVLEICALAKPEPPPARIVENPFWEEIEGVIGKIHKNNGFINLRVLIPKDSYVDEVNIKVFEESFRVVVITRDSDPKRRLLEWWDPDRPNYAGSVRLGDDEWDARTVSNNLEVARKILYEIYACGKFSDETMKNMRSQWEPKPNK